MAKEKRLNQVVRELNVGLSTITDFLHKKNIPVDDHPNAKIDMDVYDILLGEFSADKNLKSKSEKLFKAKQPTTVESSNLFKKNEENPVSKLPTEKKIDISENKEKTFSEKKETGEITGPKILGKIDLSSKKNTYVKEEIKIETPIVPVQESKVEVEKIVDVQKTTDIKPIPEIKTEDFEKKTEKKNDNIEIYTPEKDTHENEDKDKVKIVGRIDLSELNQNTRPPKKKRPSREERKQDRLKREQVLKESAIQREEERKKILMVEAVQKKQELVDQKTREDKENFIETKIEKLTGPTVVGKIELEKKKEPVEDPLKKRRRRRRKRLTKAVNKEDAAPQTDVRRKIVDKPPVPGKKPVIIKKKEKKEKNVINEEDVKTQVKATLAKLTAKKKKTGVKHRKDKREEVKVKIKREQEEQEKEKRILKVTEFVSAMELSSMMDVPVTKVISTCLDLGKMVQINQRLDADTISIVAEEYGFQAEFVSVEDHESVEEIEENEEDLKHRAPVVTVMGHVDHGKTSLLDYIRKTNVIGGEAGGITQHIGAYNVKVQDNQSITFLDTPGHEAFTAMRARGAQITDVAIVVVSATDSIMPQTREAISHAQAAGVPIVFAINKIDLPAANPEKIKTELAEMNLLVEEWGGKYQSCDISAKKGINIDKLLDEVLLAAEILELKANPDRNATGTIIESSLDKGRGYLTTVLVQAGTLKVGDIIQAGEYSGKVKAMYNERNSKINHVHPAEPALLLGLNGAPQAGVNFRVMENEKEARAVAAKYHRLKREQSMRAHRHITLDEIGRRLKIGNFQEIKIIVKGDVDGSVEAISDALLKLSTEEIQVKVIHQGVGQISEADVMLASASDAVIIGFQVRPASGARKLAEKEAIEIRLYSVIYDAIEDLKDAMEGMLSPEIREEIKGTIEVREVFDISKVGKIAGCYVLDGRVTRDYKIRLIRDGIVKHTGKLASLKRLKDDVKEVTKGYECGLNIDKFHDIMVGDIVEAFVEVEVAKKL